MTFQNVWLWLRVAENYFGAGLLVFALSFILLPTAKQVNNVYYIGLLLPAAVYLLRFPTRFAPHTLEAWLWLLFFLVASAAGFVGDGSENYFKHIGYTLTFVLITANLSTSRFFTGPKFKRAAFWIVGSYIFLSSMVYWATGAYAVGERILWLPGRMDGPIYTSMWLTACFALATSVWITEKRRLELAAALMLSLFCTIYLLQSRSGIVGLAVLPLVLLLGMRELHWKRLLRATLLVGVVIGTLWYLGILDTLIARGDAFRLTIWRQFLTDWQQCGIVRGCGLTHREVFFTLGGSELKAHSHNIYLALGVRLGLFTLLAFLATTAITLLRARRNGDSWGLYLAVSLVMLCFDGDLVIGNPDELWLLVWFPAALIINRNPPREVRLASH